jgi:hypothetical protein
MEPFSARTPVNVKSTPLAGVAGAPRFFRGSCLKPTAIDFGSGATGCYKATVNESETINEAKRFSVVSGGWHGLSG